MSTDQYLNTKYWNGLLKIGLSRFFILRVLNQNPSHGYAIARQIADFTNGCCSPSEAAIYPVLKDFVQGEYVSCHKEEFSGRIRKVYTLTDKGKKAYQVAIEAWSETTAALIKAHKDEHPNKKFENNNERGVC
ncbi:MAG: PadR family transcriptional regulator [Desulfonatronovibrio sp.]|nr:PadR family transcriptional regulator [Desulfovibrionales bacterium]